jgi:hypothetical protein
MTAGEPTDAAESCAVPGCPGEVARHLALSEARLAFPDLAERGRRAPLCREHYRAWKKATRERRALDRLGR